MPPPRDPTTAPPEPDATDDPVDAAANRLVRELGDECVAVGATVGTARSANPEALERAVRAFSREARRLGASPERMLVLLKGCLRDERLAPRDRAAFERVSDVAVRWAIETYFEPVPAG